MVFQIDEVNTLSLKISLKLSNPANYIGLKPSQCEKLRNRENITGTKIKMKNPIKLGRINEYPIRLFLTLRDRPLAFFLELSFIFSPFIFYFPYFRQKQAAEHCRRPKLSYLLTQVPGSVWNAQTFLLIHRR